MEFKSRNRAVDYVRAFLNLIVLALIAASNYIWIIENGHSLLRLVAMLAAAIVSGLWILYIVILVVQDIKGKSRSTDKGKSRSTDEFNYSTDQQGRIKDYRKVKFE